MTFTRVKAHSEGSPSLEGPVREAGGWGESDGRVKASLAPLFFGHALAGLALDALYHGNESTGSLMVVSKNR